MKRLSVRLIITSCILSVLLGIVATLAVAWALAYWSEDFPPFAGNSTRFSQHAEGPAWFIRESTRPGGWLSVGVATPQWAAEAREDDALPLPRWSYFNQPPSDDTSRRVFREEAHGWPWPAMSSVIDMPAVRTWGAKNSVNIVHGIDVSQTPPPPMPAFELKHLPTRPLWLGFVGNSLVYAAILWPLVLIFLLGGRFIFRFKHWRRKRKGQCVRCGYDLREQFNRALKSDIETTVRCPECGHH